MGNPRTWRRFWILLVTPAALLANGCTETEEAIVDDPFDYDITVSLQNLDTPVIGQAVHIFGPGETFPTGRLEPGAVPRTIVLTVSDGENVSFQAGRNGSILATKACSCTSGGCSAPKVTWGGSSLSCVGW